MLLYVYWLLRGSFFCSVFPDCKIYYKCDTFIEKQYAESRQTGRGVNKDILAGNRETDSDADWEKRGDPGWLYDTRQHKPEQCSTITASSY